MEFFDCVKGRRSVRRFTDEPVNRGEIARIVEAAIWAPSWKNTSTARFIAVESAEDRAVLAECVMGHAGNRAIINGAPVVLVEASVTCRSGYERDGSFTTAKEDRWEVYDAGLAAEALCLAAHDIGLATVIMGIFDPDAVAAAVSLPEGQRVAALIALGHPAESPAPPRRKAVDEVLSYLSFEKER